MVRRLRFPGEPWTEIPEFRLTDRQWLAIEPHLPGKAGDPGATARDNRLFVEAVLWMVQTGSPWRDMPGVFGKWYTAFARFSRWSRDGVWWALFAALADDPDFEFAIVDNAIVAKRRPGPERRQGLKIAPRAG